MVSRSAARWWAMGATAASMLVVGLDMTILNVALPDIAVSLSASGAQLQWFADAYLLVLSGLLLPAGMLGDRFGRKRFTLGGLAVFGAGSLWCALAGSPESLIAARTLLGVGAAVLIPLAMSSVVVLFNADERPKAILVLGASTMLGLPLGPIVAGVLLQHYWWGSVFLINLPVVVLALGAVVAFLPESRSTHRGLRFDALGVALSSLGLLALTYAVIEGPDRGWTDALAAGSSIGGAILVVGFFAWERRLRATGRTEPVFDFDLWADREFRWGSVTATVASLAFFGVMFAVPQYLRGVLGSDALGTGLRSLPMVVGLVIGLRLTMSLLPRLGSKLVGVAGFVLAAGGLALGTLTGEGPGYGLTAAWTALAGAGIGAALFTGQSAALASLPRDRAATGSALIQTLRQVGGVSGIAVLGVLLTAVYRSHLPLDGVPADSANAARDNVLAGVTVARRLGSSAMETQVQSAFVQSMTVTLWVSASVSLVGAAVVWLLLPGSRVITERDASQLGSSEDGAGGSGVAESVNGHSTSSTGRTGSTDGRSRIDAR